MLIYDELHADHLHVLRLLDDLLECQDDDSHERDYLVNEIRDALVPHSRAEERILYNSLRMLQGPKSMIRHSYKEHLEAEALLRTLQVESRISTGWRATAEKLKEALEHHINEEENEIFPIAFNVFSDAEAEMMGRAFVELKPQIQEEGIIGTTLDMVANLMPPRLTKALHKSEARY